MAKWQSRLNAALLLRRNIWYCSTKDKIATQIPTGYEPSAEKNGNESKYELWEVKFLGYLKIQHLHLIILSPTDQSDDIDFVEKNTTVFAELIQYLDDKSLSLVIRDAWDNGRKALTILRNIICQKESWKLFPLYRANIFEKIGIRVYYKLYDKDREYF